MLSYWDAYFTESARVQASLRALALDCERIAEFMAAALSSGGKLMFAGNGGSASDAQHLAAEFVGRFSRDRSPLAAISLSSDTSVLTALGNDYGFDQVFARQVTALGRKEDLLILISTSGRSPNILSAIGAANSMGLQAVVLTGQAAPPANVVGCAAVLCVPSDITSHIQEGHIAVGQALCGRVEQLLGLSTS